MNIHTFFISLPFLTSKAHVQIRGELSFAVHLPYTNHTNRELFYQLDSKPRGEYNIIHFKTQSTVGTTPDCVYKYPEEKQVDHLLSDLMNQLTMLFIRAKSIGESDEESNRTATRFRVVDNRHSADFDEVFSQMTRDYKEFYNTAMDKMNRSEDPCATTNQHKIKRLWQDLLTYSQRTLERATRLALLASALSQRSNKRNKREMEEMIEKETSKIRSKLLHSLCDKFQLCYNELMKLNN